MTAQPLLPLGTVALGPAPDRRVVCFQAALAEQLFDITEQERLPKVPAHGAKNQLGLGLSPLEDRWSDCLLHDLFRLPAACAALSPSPTPSAVSLVPVSTRRIPSATGSRYACVSPLPCRPEARSSRSPSAPQTAVGSLRSALVCNS